MLFITIFTAVLAALIVSQLIGIAIGQYMLHRWLNSNEE